MSIPVPPDLARVPRAVLEDYVGARVKQFARTFGGYLLPGVGEQQLDLAYNRTLQLLGTNAADATGGGSYALRFTHKCRFLGCMRKECGLCKNNPNKKCREEDNFDECYADGQVLKSKCEADVYLELINLRTGQPEAMPGVEIAVSVVDGESYSEANAGNYGHVRELLKNDDESILLGAYQAGSKTEGDGRLYLRMAEGQVKLPDLCVTDKNDTFHLNNETFSAFRLMARAVQRDGSGQLVAVDNVRPTVSGRFIVKTQRALNDYRKSEYPHYKDELTKLKHIGSITAQRLREIQQHLPDCPYASIETVEQLKQLMQYADQNRQVENKMLDLLNMKGKHKHKWDYLREVLGERVVYDDMLHRLWYADDSCAQGVLFSCKQGQLNMDRPIGLVQRAANGRLVVSSSPTGQEAEVLKKWRGMAEAAWHTPGHRGWAAVQEQLEMNTGGGGSLLLGGAPSLSVTHSMSLAADQLDEQQMLARRGSVGMPHMGGLDSARSRRSSAVSYPGPGSPEMQAAFVGLQAQGMASLGHPSSGPGAGPRFDGSAGGSMQQPLQQAMPSGGQPPFHFQGRMSGGVASVHMHNDLMGDVYRTGSAPNLVPPAANSPLYSHHSMDSSAVSGARMLAPGGASGPHSGPIGPHSANMLDGDGSGPGGVAARNLRGRRLSADASAAARQMAMMQPGQPGQDMGADVMGKRGRNASVGTAMLPDELQQHLQAQQQAQHQHMLLLQQQQQQQQHGRPPTLNEYQVNMANRHALYHFESRGRHTPRSRLNDSTDAMGSQALGSVLDASDIESYLAQNFTFVNHEPTSYPGGPPADLASGLSGGSMAAPGPASGSLSGPNGLSSPMHNLSPQQLLQSEQLTGQMQHGLILNDSMGSMGMGHDGAGAAGGMGVTSVAAMMGATRPHAHHEEAGHDFEHAAPHGHRELKRCESDSFKRFLTGAGLTFSPLEATPEELFEGIRRNSSSLMND